MRNQRIAIITFCALLPFGLVSCGDDDDGAVNNVPACESLEETLAECQPELAGTLMCSNFANTTCDIADYFACIEASYGECVDGAFPDADPTAALDCVELSTCD